MSDAVFRDGEADLSFRARRFGGRSLIYLLLIAWAIICLFPIYWTITTSFKMAPNVMQGALIPWVDYKPAWLGWRSLGLSPETIGAESTVRSEFMKRFLNSATTAIASSAIAVHLRPGSDHGFPIDSTGGEQHTGCGRATNAIPDILDKENVHRSKVWEVLILAANSRMSSEAVISIRGRPSRGSSNLLGPGREDSPKV